MPDKDESIEDLNRKDPDSPELLKKRIEYLQAGTFSRVLRISSQKYLRNIPGDTDHIVHA